ncbi:MAG: membrane dipeptidase [Sphingopyxis sp.]
MAMFTRRRVLTGGALLGTAALGGLGFGAYRLKHPALVPIGFETSAEALARARRFLAAHPSIDAHAHPGRTFVRGAEHVSGIAGAAVWLGTFEERTIADMRDGGLTAACFAAVSDFQTLSFQEEGLASTRAFEPGEAWASYKRQMANLQALVTQGLVHPIRTLADFAAARAGDKPGAMFTVEGGDFLEGRAGRVAAAYADGVRSITLMHYRNNELGDIITGSPVHGRLTQAGAAVVRAMNEAGMLIDVAHASEATAAGIIATTQKPVIASHVHVHGGRSTHPRFISQRLATSVAETGGGVLGAWPAGIDITTLDGFVTRTFELVDMVGIDHVCLGTDMDANYKPVFDTYARLPLYVAEMLKRGMHEDELAKLIGGNFLRVFGEVEAK